MHADGSQASGKVTVPGSGGTRKEVAAATSSLAQIKRVDVAVAGTKGRTCKFLNAHGRMVGRRCGSPIWLHAKGTTKWSYRFKRKLARGRYQLYVSPLNRAGASPTVFKRDSAICSPSR